MMAVTSRFAPAILLGLFLVFPFEQVHAQGENKAEAGRLADQAEAEAKARRYEKSVELYRKAFDLTGDAAFLYNISVLFLMRLESPEQAFDYASRYSEAAATEDEKKEAADLLQKIEARLKPTHGKVLVEVTPKTADLWVDRKDQSTRIRKTTAWIKAGQHSILGEAAGYDPGRAEVEVKAGAEAAVTLSLSPQKATLRVESGTEGAIVSVDGMSLGPPPAEKLVEPGEHEVKAETPKGWKYSQKITVKPGETIIVHADLAPVAGPSKAEGPSRARRIGSWVAIGAGGAAVVAGSVCYGLAYARDKDAADLNIADYVKAAGLKKGTEQYNSDFDAKKSKARNLSYAAYGLWGAGAAGVATGLILYFTGGSSGTAIVPSGPGGVGATAVFRW